MGKTNTQKSCDYRAKRDNDPDKRAAYLAKERERSKRRREKGGSIKKVSEMSNREHRHQKKVWKLAQRKHRLHKRALKEFDKSQPVDKRTTIGKKRLAASRSKTAKKLKKAEAKLRKLEASVNKYKKRLSRLSSDSITDPTYHAIVKGSKLTDQLRKTVQAHLALLGDFKRRYQAEKSHKQKKMYRQVLSGKILKRYKLLQHTRKSVGVILSTEESDRKNKNALQDHIIEDVESFYERSDNSRVLPDKRYTVKINGENKQKQFLLDTIINLHMKFLSEKPYTLHYTTFARLRPQHVVIATSQMRETCVCSLCDNFNMKVDALITANVIDKTSSTDLVSQVVCEPYNLSCMDRSCPNCADNKPNINVFIDGPVVYNQWNKHDNATVKEPIETTKGELLDQVFKNIGSYSKHQFNIRHQFLQITELKQSMDENDLLLHIDFSENYSCGYAKEIQNVHFGSSKQQAILHTGVAYTKDKPPASFCTISNDKRHTAAAVWGHLDPILDEYRCKKRVHFISDGPSSQYKNKFNMRFMCEITKEKGFESATWNYLARGHGKGAADGIGGVIKSMADRLMRNGQDIPTALDLYNILKPKTTVKLYFVESESIDHLESRLLTETTTIPGIMAIHQAYVLEDGRLWTRCLSCFCRGTLPCKCYQPASFTIEKTFDDTVDVTAANVDGDTGRHIVLIHPPPSQQNNTRRSQRVRKRIVYDCK